MTDKNNTTKEKSFKHLNVEQRMQIEYLLKQNLPKTKIAETLGIARSTLYREIERGTVELKNSNLKLYKTYGWDVGQRRYKESRANCKRPLKLVQAYAFIKYAEEQILKNKLSPDTICGREKVLNEFSETVCSKTIYNYIDKGLLKVINIDLPLRVRYKNKRRIVRKNRRLYGLSIDERPDRINNREEFGHWEIDTIVGTRETGAAILTLDERLTRKRIMLKIESKTSDAVCQAIERLKALYGSRFPQIFRSITSDNGSEFSELPKVFGEIPVYYTHPYSAYERGTNEKQNSLVRRFLPKGKSFDNLTNEALTDIEAWINNLPRKIFNYASSQSLFDSVLFDIAS